MDPYRVTRMPDIAIHKKRKLEASKASAIAAASAAASPSKIFSPFRAIGNVTNHVPFAIGTLGTSYYVVTSVGRSYQIYDASTLHLLFVSQKQTASDITCLYAHFQYVYAAFDNCINIYKRGSLLHTLTCLVPNVLDSNIKISRLVQFGDYLVAISSTSNHIFIFKKPANGSSKLPLEFFAHIKVNESYGNVLHVVHPATYLNKIIVATQTNVIVYNIRSLKMIHKSKYDFNKDSFGSITTIELAPALDIVAIGTNLSNIVLLNFKKDKIIKKITFNNHHLKEPSSITSLSFRTDGSPHLVAGYRNGDLIFFDLNSNTRIHSLHSIHKETGISNVKFLNGQPIFITNGGDNHLREFVFDPSLSATNGTNGSAANATAKKTVVPPPRRLRSRGGHSAPPTMISFTDDKDHFVISGSKDRSFWSFSLRKDSQAQEFSQKSPKGSQKFASSNLKEKIPELVCVAFSEARQTDWENIITGHENEKFARTWSFENKRLGRWRLMTPDDGFVKSACISQCGNFGIIGSSNGSIAIYNLQSGILRKQYKFHKRSVTGIAIDNMNQKMCSVGLDGLVGFYDFNQSKLLGKIDLESPVTLLKYHKSSDLIAVALDDLTIVIMDMVTKRIVRQLVGHRNRITSLDFSPDGRWLVSASLDSTVRTWNLPTGGCIDGFKVDNIVTNLLFSPTGNFLATTHVTGNGISLWNNKSQFKAVSTKHVTEEEFGDVVSLPNSSGDGGSSLLDGALLDNEADTESLFTSDINDNYKTVAQINKDLITLNIGSRNKFNTILHLDTIRQRNKPKEAPKKPELAPFFLQTFGDANKSGENQVKIDTLKNDTLASVAATTEPQVDSSNENNDNEDEDNEDSNGVKLLPLDEKDNNGDVILSRIAKEQAVSFENKFTRLLKATVPSSEDEEESQFIKVLHAPADSQISNEITSEMSAFLDHLLSLSPSTLDLEIKQLNVISDPSLQELKLFIRAITFGLQSNADFEIYQAIMNVMLRTHGDIIQEKISSDIELDAVLQDWNRVNDAKVQKMDDLVKNCSGIINFLSSL